MCLFLFIYICLLICFHLYIYIAPICIFTCYRYSIIYIGSCLFTQTPRALTLKRGKHQKQTQGKKRQTSKHRETGNYRVQRRCKKSAIHGCASRFIYVTLDPSSKCSCRDQEPRIAPPSQSCSAPEQEDA